MRSLRLFLVALAVEQDRRAVSVGAAGELSLAGLEDHLRVAGGAEVTPSWCEETSFAGSGFVNRGCGLCASSCNSHSPQTLSATDPDAQVIKFQTQTECVSACNSKPASKPCLAISFDDGAEVKTCTLHFTMPVGAVCGDACGANPHNTGDSIAQHRIHGTPDDPGCGGQACFVKEAAFTGASAIHRLGHGSCHRGEVSPGQPGGMIIVSDLIVEGVSSLDGLTPASKACSDTSEPPVTSDCWPPATKVAWCEAQCNALTTCRAFNFGKRFKGCEGGACNFSSQPGEYYCTLFGVTPSRASLDEMDWRELGCHAYQDASASFSSQIDITSYGQCRAPYGPDCYVRTTRATEDYIERGPGYCQSPDGTEAAELRTLSAGAGNTFTMTQCQAECSEDPACVGLAHGISVDPSHPSSFCRLYKACEDAHCPAFQPGQHVTTSSVELVALQHCGDLTGADGTIITSRCGGSVGTDGTIITPPTPCSCATAGWRADEGDANWTDELDAKFACCEGACKTCMTSYSSECFARATV